MGSPVRKAKRPPRQCAARCTAHEPKSDLVIADLRTLLLATRCFMKHAYAHTKAGLRSSRAQADLHTREAPR